MSLDKNNYKICIAGLGYVGLPLEAIGVKANIKQPRNIELGFVCVYHDQILEFLNSFDGVVYEYKKSLIS